MPCFIKTSSKPIISAFEINLSSFSMASSALSPCKSSITLAFCGFCTLICVFGEFLMSVSALMPPFVSAFNGTRIFMPFASIVASFLFKVNNFALILPYFTLSPGFSGCGAWVWGLLMALIKSFALFMALWASFTSCNFAAFLASFMAK